MLSEKDILAGMGLGKTASFTQIVARCLTSKGCMAMALRNHADRESMSTPPITAGPDMAVAALSALFAEKHI